MGDSLDALTTEPVVKGELPDEQWYVIVDEKGEERSSGTVVAEKLPDGWQAIPLAKMPESDKETWSKDEQAYVAKPVAAEPVAAEPESMPCPTCGRGF